MFAWNLGTITTRRKATILLFNITDLLGLADDIVGGHRIFRISRAISMQELMGQLVLIALAPI